MSIPMNFKKAELIERLRALLPAARKADTKVVAEHRKAEQVYLAKFRAACREALKWDYKTLSDMDFEIGLRDARGYRLSSPDCPLLRENAIQRLIDQVEMSGLERFRVTPNGCYSDIWRELSATMTPPKEPC